MESFPLPQDGAFVRYLDLPGSAPPIVWLHCLGGAAVAYVQTARQPILVAHRAILIDLPGFGCSDAPQAFGYALDDHARAVAALLDHLGLRDVAVVGHSLGGSVAIMLAALRPDLVGRLIIAEAPLELAEESASRAFAAQEEAAFVSSGFAAFLAPLRDAALAGDATLASFVGQFQIAAPCAVHRTAVGMMAATPALRARFLALAMPRSYLWGEQTLRDEPDATRIAAGLIAPGLAVQTVLDAGHLMNLDNPAGFAAAVAGVLGEGGMIGTRHLVS